MNNKIIETKLVYYYKKEAFDDELKYQVNVMQNRGLTVEIQFSVSGGQFHALLIGRREK